LRASLNAVLTSALLIQRRSTEEPVRDTAGRILSSGRRMSRMIEDMLIWHGPAWRAASL